MAYVVSMGLDELKELDGDVIKSALKKGIDIYKPVVEKRVKQAASKGTERGFEDGEKAHLAEHIKTAAHNANAKGEYVAVLSFNGSFERGKRKIRRNLVAAVLEYGKQGQEPTHFLEKSKKEKMEEVKKVVTDEISKATFNK